MEQILHISRSQLQSVITAADGTNKKLTFIYVNFLPVIPRQMRWNFWIERGRVNYYESSSYDSGRRETFFLRTYSELEGGKLKAKSKGKQTLAGSTDSREKKDFFDLREKKNLLFMLKVNRIEVFST